jgi:hypothetical protein
MLQFVFSSVGSARLALKCSIVSRVYTLTLLILTAFASTQKR